MQLEFVLAPSRSESALIEFVLGPAGSGKTFGCLKAVRAALEESAEGPPLIFIAPKQATYQLERQLLTPHEPAVEGLSGRSVQGLAGYTRLRIVSFERLAKSIFDQASRPQPRLLSEEGRVMVLRALLARHEGRLQLFRASARAPGFAQELSRLIRELQQSRCSPASLAAVAKKAGGKGRLKAKLSDVALLFEEYQKWLLAQQLDDADRLVELAADLLEQSPELQFEAVWLDGFAQLNAQERRLLRALAFRSRRMTLAFCLDASRPKESWHSHWFAVSQCVSELKLELESIPGLKVEVRTVGEDAGPDSRAQRFATAPELAHLEQHWGEPRPYTASTSDKGSRLEAVRLVECPDAESEAIFAAREILRYVRQGGRFRETAIIVRQLDKYHDVLRRVFLRYEVPFFLDRREPIAHHPLAELTRGALKTLAFNWRRQDWFCALKSGLIPAAEHEIDVLENQALARGWEGAAWQKPLSIRNDAALTASLEELRQRLIKPFLALAQRWGTRPTGAQLSEGLHRFWKELGVEAQLERWSVAAKESGQLHATVWDQVQQWVDTLALAFGTEAQSLKQWIPIVESGLGALSIGVVPPVLDQVLLGSVDRSRNPDLRQVFVLGLNETVFPAPPAAPAILTELDRELLEAHRLALGATTRMQIGQERFFGYVACTRARERLTLTYALRDSQGSALNPSSLVDHVQRLFPQLKEPERFEAALRWQDAEHYCELVSPLLGTSKRMDQAANTLARLPGLAPILERLTQANPAPPILSPELAQALYGPLHETSVSGLEKFASCPFSFFIESGLKAQERARFELDARQQGTFQHAVLERFHVCLKEQGKTWHTVTVEEARQHVGRIADELLPDFQEGMLIATEANRFVALHQKQRLQKFIELLVGWMQQYEFEPARVELRFGLAGSELPAWRIDVSGRGALALRGSIDRVDLYRPPGSDEVLCVVMDYKSRAKNIDRVLMKHGVQLQLPGYLAALRRIESAKAALGVETLRPVGVFFVNLRGDYESGANRNEVLADKAAADRRAFQHTGVYDSSALRYLDSRGANCGDQIPYKNKLDGSPGGTVKGPMTTEQFLELLAETEAQVYEFGRQIYEGKIDINPFKRGRITACKSCEHSPICRIDPWAHEYRHLKKEAAEE